MREEALTGKGSRGGTEKSFLSVPPLPVFQPANMGMISERIIVSAMITAMMARTIFCVFLFIIGQFLFCITS